MSSFNETEPTEMAGVVKDMVITPEMAKQLLHRGGRNRPVRDTRIQRYAKDMKAGAWLFNGETVKINRQGEVLDGQHRLLACVEAETAFRSLVVYDIESDVFPTLDDGGTRTLADALAIEETPNYTSIAAGLGWVWLYDNGGLGLEQRPSGPSRGTKRQLLAYYHSCDAEQWQRAVLSAKKAKNLVHSIGIAAACHFIFQRHSAAKVDEFFEDLMVGSLENDSPVYHLRRRLMKDVYEDRHSKLKAGAKIALIIKAWRAFVDGTPMKQLRLVASDKENFPKAEGPENVQDK